MSTEQCGSLQQFVDCACEHDKNEHGIAGCDAWPGAMEACPCTGYWTDVHFNESGELVPG